jgi:pentatricopeptide repeat protein
LEQLQQIKSSGKKRVPIHISQKINEKLASPSVLTIHSNLEKGHVESAWKLVDKSASELAQQYIPRLTARMLLDSLYAQVNTNLPRLTLDFGKLENLYFTRLELLAGIIRRNRDLYWDAHEFGMVIELYGKLDQVKRAESIFRNMMHYTSPDQAAPTVELYNRLLAVYVRRFKYVDDMTKKRFFSKMKSLETEMLRKGLEPDTASFNLMLAAKVKLHDLQGAEKIYSQMTTMPDRTTYNILLNGYLKDCRNNKDKEITNQWMERLIGSGIVPNKRTFKNVMDGLSDQVIRHARMKEEQDMQATAHSVSNLYKVMLKLGHKPDTETVNTLLKCYIAANDTDSITKMMDMLILPEKKGGCGNCGCGKAAAAAVEIAKKPKYKIKPDTYTFNMLIKHHLSNNNTDQAFQMYDTMVNLELDPDTITYGNFVWYYADQGNVTECLRYVDVMQRKGILCNNYIYNTLLNCSLKYPDQAHLIAPHLRVMMANGASTLDSVSQNIQLARHSLRDQESLESGFDRFTDLLEQNVYSNSGELDAPSTRTYNTILQSAGKFYKKSTTISKPHQKELNMTLDNIMASLDTSRLRPDVYTFALSIRNAAYVGDMMKAESIYKAMVDSGVKPNQFVFSHLIYGYANMGKVEKAQDILRHMSSAPYNIRPTAVNYAALIKGFAESAEFEKAYELFREMLDKNITADLVIYTILASVFLGSPVRENGRRAIDLLEGIAKAGIELDSVSLTLLAQAYALEAASILDHGESIGQKKQSKEQLVHHRDKINQIYATLKEKNWLDPKAITTILSAHNRMHDPEATWKLWNELKADSSITLTSYHYNTVITGLTSSKAWYPVAKLVFEDMLENPLVQPDFNTFDLLIWGAYSVSDYQTIRQLWNSPQRLYPESNMPFSLLVRTYFAAMTAMLNNNEVESAKRVYEEYRKLPTPPSSTTVWVGNINKLANDQGFK